MKTAHVSKVVETLWCASVQSFIVRVVGYATGSRRWIEIEGYATIEDPKTAETLSVLIATAGEMLARLNDGGT